MRTIEIKIFYSEDKAHVTFQVLAGNSYWLDDVEAVLAVIAHQLRTSKTQRKTR